MKSPKKNPKVAPAPMFTGLPGMGGRHADCTRVHAACVVSASSIRSEGVKHGESAAKCPQLYPKVKDNQFASGSGLNSTTQGENHSTVDALAGIAKAVKSGSASGGVRVVEFPSNRRQRTETGALGTRWQFTSRPSLLRWPGQGGAAQAERAAARLLSGGAHGVATSGAVPNLGRGGAAFATGGVA